MDSVLISSNIDSVQFSLGFYWLIERYYCIIYEILYALFIGIFTFDLGAMLRSKCQRHAYLDLYYIVNDDNRETSLFPSAIKRREFWQPALNQSLLNRKVLISDKAEVGSAESSCAASNCARFTALNRAAVI